MRLLFLAHRVPDRPTKGDKIRAWHELRALAARHEVHLFALADEAETEERAAPEWADEVASATIVPIGPLAAKLRMAGALVTGKPLTAAHFAAPELRRRLAAAQRERPFDAAVVYSGAMEPLVRRVTPKVVDLVDVDSEKFRLYHERGTVRGLKRLACAVEWRRLRRLERRICEHAEVTLVCTGSEADTLRSFAKPRRLEVLGNGVDLEAFPFVATGDRARDEILFVGALDYPANVDACEHLVRDLLPRIRFDVPGAHVTLVGRGPTAAVRELATLPGVTLEADVESVAPFVQRATLTLLPFRVARGIQNKALEALASGLPVVASRETTKGLEGVEGRDWLAGGDPHELVRQATRVLKDADLRDRLALNGRTLVESRYAWHKLLDRFVGLVEEVARGARPRPPARSVQGAAP